MTLYKRVRIQVKLPDVSSDSFQEIINKNIWDFTTIHGSCDIFHQVDTFCGTRHGLRMRDRSVLISADATVSLPDDELILTSYIHNICSSLENSLEGEPFVITAHPILQFE